jgi:hypothetical protein
MELTRKMSKPINFLADGEFSFVRILPADFSLQGALYNLSGSKFHHHHYHNNRHVPEGLGVFLVP